MNPDLDALLAEKARRMGQEPTQAAPAPSSPQDSGDTGGLIQSVYNPILAASQGLQQGVVNAASNAQLSLRSITDALGFTSAEDTQKARESLVQQNSVTDAAAQKLGSSTVGGIAKFVGNMAPGAALAVASGGTSTLANAVQGAVQGFATDSGDGLKGQLYNAIGGAAVGGALGKLANLASAKVGLEIDPVKAEYFRQYGLKVRASQVAVDPTVAATLGTVEKSLNTVPWGLGIKGTVKDQTAAVSDLMQKVIGQLDGMTPSSAELYQKAVDAPEVARKFFSIDPIKNQAAAALEKLNAYGKELPDIVRSKLEGLTQLGTVNMGDLQKVRQDFDGLLGGLKKGKTLAESEAYKTLSGLRGTMADTLDSFAAANHVSSDWALGNAAWKTEFYNDTLRENVLPAGFDLHGNTDLGSEFKPRAFLNALNKTVEDLKDKNITPLPQVQKAIDAIQHIGATVFGPNAAKASTSAPLNLGNTLKTAGEGAAAVGAVLHPAIAIPAAALFKGLGLMTTTPTGLQLLAAASGKGVGAPITRLMLTSAMAIGQAHQARDGVVLEQAQKQAELQALLAEKARRQQGAGQ